MRGDGLGAYTLIQTDQGTLISGFKTTQGVKQDNDTDVTLMCSCLQISVVYLVNDTIYYKVLSPLLFLYSLTYWKLQTLVTPVFFCILPYHFRDLRSPVLVKFNDTGANIL